MVNVSHFKLSWCWGCTRWIARAVRDVTAVVTGKVTISQQLQHAGTQDTACVSYCTGRKSWHVTCNTISGVRTGSECGVIMPGKGWPGNQTHGNEILFLVHMLSHWHYKERNSMNRRRLISLICLLKTAVFRINFQNEAMAHTMVSECCCLPINAERVQ